MVGVCWVLWRWEPSQRQKPAHPESIWGAIRGGFHYAWYTPKLGAILGRVFLFIFFAGVLATFAIVIGGNVLKVGEGSVAFMMACMGAGAIVGVYYMQPLQRRMGVERSVALCTALYGLAMLGVALTPSLWFACFAMLVAGFNWVIVPTNFNIATQLAVPAWIKGRAMGMYVLVLWGSMAAGPAVFGKIADSKGPRTALAWAAIGVLVSMVAIIWLRLVPKSVEDYAPAKRDPVANPDNHAELQSGPVWVAVDYRVTDTRADEFRTLMHHLRRQRLRNGAAAWHLHDGSGSGTFTESFAFPSWGARLRHHERTTKADAALEDQVHALHAGEQGPVARYSTTPPAGYAAK